MADELVKVKMKNGTIKEFSAHVAYNPQHQKAYGFTPIDEAGNPLTQTTEPEKKMTASESGENNVATDENLSEENLVNDEELGANVETETLDEEIVNQPEAPEPEKKEVVKRKPATKKPAPKKAAAPKTK